MKELNVSKNTIKSIINTTLTSKQIDDAVKEYGLATKGKPQEPEKGFSLKSVHYERQTLETVYIPDYYYDMIEQMCPGLQYLEVFSHRQYSDSWHIFDTNSGNN